MGGETLNTKADTQRTDVHPRHLGKETCDCGRVISVCPGPPVDPVNPPPPPPCFLHLRTRRPLSVCPVQTETGGRKGAHLFLQISVGGCGWRDGIVIWRLGCVDGWVGVCVWCDSHRTHTSIPSVRPLGVRAGGCNWRREGGLVVWSGGIGVLRRVRVYLWCGVLGVYMESAVCCVYCLYRLDSNHKVVNCLTDHVRLCHTATIPTQTRHSISWYPHPSWCCVSPSMRGVILPYVSGASNYILRTHPGLPSEEPAAMLGAPVPSPLPLRSSADGGVSSGLGWAGLGR